jgi:hypothetical protein
MRRRVIDPKIVAVFVLALATSPSVALAQAKQAGAPSSSSAKLTPELMSARDALAKYADPLVAVRDGYFSTVACVDFPHGAKEGSIEYPPGAMGVHFLNTAHVGPQLDPAKPQVLIYEPTGGGKLKLVAAEWFVPAQVVGDKPAPTIFGQALSGPMDGHEPIMPKELRHYDLHVWLWKDNPKGLFSSTNAAVKCDPKGPYTSLHH